MAYSVTIPPILESQSPCGGAKTWNYRSADAVGTVDAAGYFTNAQDLGMGLGDKVQVYNTTSSLAKQTDAYVSAVSSTGGTIVITSS